MTALARATVNIESAISHTLTELVQLVGLKRSERVYATVRIYENVENPANAIKQVGETFLPLMKEIPGFVDYYWVDVGEAGGRMVAISVFETSEAAEESNRRAAQWIQEHPGVVPTGASAEAGEVVVRG